MVGSGGKSASWQLKTHVDVAASLSWLYGRDRLCRRACKDGLPIAALCPNKRQGLEAEVPGLHVFAFGEGEAVASQPLLWLHLSAHVRQSGLGSEHRLSRFANPL